ncbi:class II histocompatibility antigen, B-L beta chain-like [Acipenser oxyrinchus oxyrinchus]|uniref:Class II histocompatibility antigen, B-L beta chain-like n=1 Tax=Acipenser oxyrinchus oxyrinchus TaxID=40147 RepID=A0AAD8CEI7_ACIOX|nr:class II histocompatibility antigen, B-L beta chain-like [Acipenser oxyrinchus oxyrinchus]
MDVKWVPGAALNMGFVAGGVLAALGLIIAVIIGVHIWKKRASGARSPDYTPAQKSSADIVVTPPLVPAETWPGSTAPG